jgi:hypothetical protein
MPTASAAVIIPAGHAVVAIYRVNHPDRDHQHDLMAGPPETKRVLIPPV